MHNFNFAAPVPARLRATRRPLLVERAVSCAPLGEVHTNVAMKVGQLVCSVPLNCFSRIDGVIIELDAVGESVKPQTQLKTEPFFLFSNRW